jgi:predicted CXXCH cytochrome family protein
MPLNRGTQKQIAQRFKGNLDYFRKAHYWKRLRFWSILVVSLIGAAIMALTFIAAPEAIYNPGPISQPHASFAEDCSKCHEPLNRSLVNATVKLSNESIDQRCAGCHKSHSFHQPNVVHERSCTACHQEHRGAGPMAMPGDGQCARCHDNSEEMAASAARGKELAAALFDYRASAGWNAFKAPRPDNGFTDVFASFAGDHPEFRLLADKLRETNTLRFNHKRHLAETNDMPLLNGRPMDCAFCHQPGPGGAFFQRISYERNCQTCHSLQLDDAVPELAVPHGRVAHVRAFLRSLPAQYAAVAQRRTNAPASDEERFVTAQMARLRHQFVDGTNLEAQVFFTSLRRSPDGRTKFDGCATCHEVTHGAANTPRIAPVSLPDRWMARARFNHASHSSLACVRCHSAPSSAETADVIMPSKTICVECHSPQGRVNSSCSLCHTYHSRRSLEVETRLIPGMSRPRAGSEQAPKL